MTSIHIGHVAPETLHALKRLARSHHRSLQGELHAILERAAKMAPPDDAGGFVGLGAEAARGDSVRARSPFADCVKT